MFKRPLYAVLGLTLVLPASAAPSAPPASAKPAAAPAAKLAPATEAAKPTPPPSPFDSWARPLAGTERALAPNNARAKALDVEVSALKQRLSEAQAEATRAEKAASTALTAAKATQNAYDKRTTQLAKTEPLTVLEKARAGYAEARAQTALRRDQLKAKSALDSELAAKAAQAASLADEAKASRASVKKAREELREALRKRSDDARLLGKTLSLASSQTGHEKPGSLEAKQEISKQASATLAAEVALVNEKLREVEALLKALPKTPTVKP